MSKPAKLFIFFIVGVVLTTLAREAGTGAVAQAGATAFVVCAFGFWFSLVGLLLHLTLRSMRKSDAVAAEQLPRGSRTAKWAAIFTAIFAAGLITGFGLCGEANCFSCPMANAGADIVFCSFAGLLLSLVVYTFSRIAGPR